jgi:hypothetical protein
VRLAQRRLSAAVLLAAAVAALVPVLSGGSFGQPAHSVKAKSWPVGYFFPYQKATLKERERLFADIEAKLKQINENKEALVVKGTMIGQPRLDLPTYPQMTVFDESGLRVIVRRVPNIYYRFTGPPAAINKNIYMVVNRLKLNRVESNLNYTFVVEGEFLAFAHNYMTEILKDLDNSTRRGREGER